MYPKYNLGARIIHPCRNYKFILQAPRIEPSPLFIIVTGVIINLRVSKHSLWTHVVFVVAQNNGTVSFPSPQNTHLNSLSYCLVVLHHTLKLTHAFHFAFISLFYIIHFSVLNHNTTYTVQTSVFFFCSTICKNLLFKQHFCKHQIGYINKVQLYATLCR